MGLRLNSKQRDMLIEVKERFSWNKEFELEKHPTCYVLQFVDEDDTEDLRGLCSDYLLEIGFDRDYVANEKGKTLESLVDKLYAE